MSKIEILIFENTDKWFWKVESLLQEKRLWKIIKDIISATEQSNSANSAASSEQISKNKSVIISASLSLSLKSLEDKKVKSE